METSPSRTILSAPDLQTRSEYRKNSNNLMTGYVVRNFLLWKKGKKKTPKICSEKQKEKCEEKNTRLY